MTRTFLEQDGWLSMTHFRFHRLDCFSFSFFPAVMYFRASNLSFYYCLLLSFIFCITVVFCCLSSFVFRDFFVCSHVLSSINSFVSLLSFVVFHLFFLVIFLMCQPVDRHLSSLSELRWWIMTWLSSASRNLPRFGSKRTKTLQRRSSCPKMAPPSATRWASPKAWRLFTSKFS